MAKRTESRLLPTPGPWFFDPVELIVYDGQKKAIKPVATITQRAEPSANSDETSANGWLIAAAPELLSRLRSLVEDLKGGKDLMLSQTESDSWMVTEDGWDVLIDRSEAIIRKAEGKA